MRISDWSSYVCSSDLSPIVDELNDCLAAKRRRMFSGSPTLKAINYALSHWAGLVRFLDDGRIHIDNNPVERSMRTIVLQRKNALFAGSELGTETWENGRAPCREMVCKYG